MMNVTHMCRMTDGYKHESLGVQSSKSIRQYDAAIDRSPSSSNFLLYQEDDNVSSDSEDLRDCTPLYLQHLATAPTASMARTLVRGSLALSTR
jgi:hypothetical protein